MRKRVDPVGRLLLRSGVLDEDMLADVLDLQRHTLPFASLCHVLGLVDEEMLVLALSKQRGVPGLVLSRSVVNLTVLEDVPEDMARKHVFLPVLEDASRVFVAVEDPSNTAILRELGFLKGKAIVPHVALHISIARAIRGAYLARGRGETQWYGERATTREPEGGPGRMWVVSDVDHVPGDLDTESSALPDEDVTKELFEEDLLDFDYDGRLGPAELGREDAPSAHRSSTGGVVELSDVSRSMATPVTGGPESTDRGVRESSVDFGPDSAAGVIDLDDEGSAARALGTPIAQPGQTRVLIVDDDFATRHLLVKVLGAEGYFTDTAASGMEAVERLRLTRPDLVVIDVMLPEIDGFQICRSIKSSRKYRHIPVVLLSAVIDSGRVTEEVLRRYGAEAYFEKPINTDRLKLKIRELLGARAAPVAAASDGSFESAIDLYRAGKLDDAIEILRAGLSVDPLSSKHHFVLANLLQKKNEIYEAIDEYEATVNLKPDYFPALSRLAYLYYKKGFSAKAIETWRRSLPHCPDAELRQNIEMFMRKLIADMQSEER
jgi:CheY-like chemotaxis protein